MTATLKGFRALLEKDMQGPGWERHVESAIGIQSALLEAIRARVPTWNPAECPTEVVGYLADKLDEAEQQRECALGHVEALTEALRRYVDWSSCTCSKTYRCERCQGKAALAAAGVEVK